MSTDRGVLRGSVIAKRLLIAVMVLWVLDPVLSGPLAARESASPVEGEGSRAPARMAIPFVAESPNLNDFLDGAEPETLFHVAEFLQRDPDDGGR